MNHLDDPFHDDPFWRGPKVAANFRDLLAQDALLAQPLAVDQPSPDDRTRRQQERQACAAALAVATRIRIDLDVLRDDVAWASTLPGRYPIDDIDIGWNLLAVPGISDVERTAARAWIDDAGGLGALATASTDFTADLRLLDRYEGAVRRAGVATGDVRLGQVLEFGPVRRAASVVLLEAGVLAAQADLCVAGIRGCETYPS